MTVALEFYQVAEPQLERARQRIESELAGLPEDEAFLRLRLEFEQLLVEQHGLGPAALTVLFRPLESLPTFEERLDYLLHMAATYVVACGYDMI